LPFEKADLCQIKAWEAILIRNREICLKNEVIYMDIRNKDKIFDLNEVLRWCFQVQRNRILRALFYEMSSQKVSPNLRREIVALTKIAQLIASNSQRTGFQSGGAESPAEPTGQTEVRQEIRDLDPEDRHLLREVVTILAELEKNKDNQVTVDLKEQNNEQKKQSAE
jgi:hypothetical protein